MSFYWSIIFIMKRQSEILKIDFLARINDKMLWTRKNWYTSYPASSTCLCLAREKRLGARQSRRDYQARSCIVWVCETVRVRFFCHERRSVTVVLSHTFGRIHHLQRYKTNLICPVPDEIVYNLLASAWMPVLRKLGTTGRITDNKCRLKINSSGIFLSIIIRIT